jgi:hypothetical protein
MQCIMSFSSWVLLLFSVWGAVGVGDTPRGVFPNAMRWHRNAIVEVHFNPALASVLENPGRVSPPFPSIGDAGDRLTAMDNAINDWNGALKKISAALRLSLVTTRTTFAATQSPQRCADSQDQSPVFVPVFPRLDGLNVASTAMAIGKMRGAGRISSDQIVESAAIDKRLAETRLTPSPQDLTANWITEADILWYTHFNEGNHCPPIRWNYRYLLGPGVQPPAAGYYDFYTVMLHELGHLLGLDHQDCAERGKVTLTNVMSGTLAAGERQAILACELDALDRLYGRENAQATER